MSTVDAVLVAARDYRRAFNATTHAAAKVRDGTASRQERDHVTRLIQEQDRARVELFDAIAVHDTLESVARRRAA